MNNFRRYFLIYKGEQTEIKEPLKFDAFKPKLSRGNSHGTIWEYANLSIGFSGVAYDICKLAYDNEGIEAEVTLLVEEKYNNVWGEFYNGRLDFAQYIETKGNANVIELGVAQLDAQTIIRNRLDTKVELESLKGFEGADLPEYANLKRSIKFEGKSVLTKSRAESQLPHSTITNHSPGTYFNIIFRDDIKSELFPLNAFDPHDGNEDDIQPIFTIPEDDVVFSNIKIKSEFGVLAKYTELPQYVVMFDLYYKINDNTPILIGSSPEGDQVDVTLDLSLTLNAGDKFYLYGLAHTIVMAPEWIYIISPHLNKDLAFFEVSGVSKYKSTNANVSLVHESLSRIVESITDGAVSVQSNYYARIDSNTNPTSEDGCGSLRGIISGLNLRNGVLTDKSKPLTYISLKAMLESLSAIDCIGYGVQGDKLVVEPYKYFYSDELVMICNDASNVERKIDLSRSFQLFNNGYKKWEAEEYNGIDGFHGKRQYRTHLKMSDTKLEKECNFIADGYAIEATRRRQIETESKDWRYDNDLFIVCLKRDSDNLVVDTGVLDKKETVVDADSIYNAPISPARNAMRWYSWVMQGVKQDDRLIFSGGEGYTKAELETTEGCIIEASALNESQDISAGSFNDNYYFKSIFKPEILSFTYPITREDFVKIKSNPYGLIQVNGELGWIKEIEFDLLKCQAKFTLIAQKR